MKPNLSGFDRPEQFQIGLSLYKPNFRILRLQNFRKTPQAITTRDQHYFTVTSMGFPQGVFKYNYTVYLKIYHALK